jgi:hypothetical protein
LSGESSSCGAQAAWVCMRAAGDIPPFSLARAAWSERSRESGRRCSVRAGTLLDGRCLFAIVPCRSRPPRLIGWYLTFGHHDWLAFGEFPDDKAAAMLAAAAGGRDDRRYDSQGCRSNVRSCRKGGERLQERRTLVGSADLEQRAQTGALPLALDFRGFLWSIGCEPIMRSGVITTVRLGSMMCDRQSANQR